MSIQAHVPVFTYHAVAVGSGPLSFQSGGHLQATVLFPVGPTGGAEPTLHVRGSPRVPLVGAASYTHRAHQSNAKLMSSFICVKARDKGGKTTAVLPQCDLL